MMRCAEPATGCAAPLHRDFELLENPLYDSSRRTSGMVVLAAAPPVPSSATDATHAAVPSATAHSRFSVEASGRPTPQAQPGTRPSGAMAAGATASSPSLAAGSASLESMLSPGGIFMLRRQALDEGEAAGEMVAGQPASAGARMAGGRSNAASGFVAAAALMGRPRPGSIWERMAPPLGAEGGVPETSRRSDAQAEPLDVTLREQVRWASQPVGVRLVTLAFAAPA